MLRWMALLACISASFNPSQDGASATQQIDYAYLHTPVETRAIWIDAGAIPKTEQGVREMVRSYRAANLNTLLPESVMRGYAVYDSDYVERDPRFEGAPDVLEVMIDEAHRLGMEVHPWVWVFRAGYTQDIGSVLRAHPNWVAVNKDGETLSANGGYWISACNNQARDFLAGLLAELVSRYDVDGLHLDYIRYEVEKPTPYGYSGECRRQFEAEYGVDPSDIERLSVHQSEWNRWRERQINTFVQRIALQTRTIRPEVRISAAVGADPAAARLELMQNWPNWVENKWVDFITPMAYARNNDAFLRMIGDASAAVDYKTLLTPGIGAFLHSEPDQTIQQIGAARGALGAGQALFAASYFTQDLSNALQVAPYTGQALAPYRDPWERSLELFEYGMRMRREGQLDLASFYCDTASAVAKYAKYQQKEVGYVPPTPPPLTIPETVLPLPTVAVPKATSLIVIDGDTDDPAWNTAAQVTLSYTDQGQPAPVNATAHLAYDERNLYIAFVCEELRMPNIKATVEQRDGPVFDDDSVEVFVGLADQQDVYHHFAVNTLGTQFDEKGTKSAWTGDWEAAAKLGTQAWTAEIAIPFETLGQAASAQQQTLALNLTRNRTVTGEMVYLTWAVPYGSFHSPDRFGRAVLE